MEEQQEASPYLFSMVELMRRDKRKGAVSMGIEACYLLFPWHYYQEFYSIPHSGDEHY
ncbi:MAG: hypothetical protein MJE68_07015 [Proteobacteria bacterium]|nr:hypothetical protein [Pseudomonadota bacterium]